MSVNSVQNSTATSVGGLATGSVQAMQNQFLTLLVTQMQNQDPLNPMDNSQVTTQLAQLSTVNGINNLNTTMSSLSSALLSNQVLQSASLIGKTVLADGSSMTLQNGGASYGVNLPQAVDSMTVSITDAAGNTVKTLNLGAQQAGTLSLQWDGTTNAGAQVPNGTYNFSVKASQGGTSVAATTLSPSVVSSVSQNANGVQLNLGNGSTVDLSAVKQIS
ncbi:MAG: flagellar hook assembly protein FlgD [Burkholderiales bacterium]